MKKKAWLLAEKAYQLVQNNRMKDVQKLDIKNEIEKALNNKNFNLYKFVNNQYF